MEDPEPEHPFQEAEDAAYVPPADQNVGAPPPQVTKKPEPAYKTQPAVYNPLITTDV